MFLVCWLCLAFMDGMPMKVAMMAMFAAWAFVPLGLGVAVTPGDRWQEGGAVLIASAVATALLALMLVLLALDAEFLALMSPESKEWLDDVDDLPTGFSMIAVTGGLGWWLARGRRGKA